MAETKPILRSSNSNSVPDAENPEEVTKSSEINETYSSDKENAGKNASVEASVIETSKEQRVPKKKRSLSKKAGLAFPVMRIFKKTNSINKNIKYRKGEKRKIGANSDQKIENFLLFQLQQCS